MANTITTKYGTKINVKGLTPEQIQKVRGIAENNGAYGAKGAALADTFRKKAAKTIPIDKGGVVPGATPGAQPAPDINMDEWLDQQFANLGELDLTGAPAILNGEDLNASRQGVYDSIYAQQTKNLDRNRARDLEAQKQELADRGIPINFGGEDLYSKSIGAVNERYDTLSQDAANAANVGADQSLANLAQTNKLANDSFMQGVTAKYGSKLDAITAGLSRYGIDQQAAEAAKDRALQRWVTNKQLAGRGGGGRSSGGGSSNSPIIGGVAPGFGV